MMGRSGRIVLAVVAAGVWAPQVARGQVTDATIPRLMEEHSVPGLALAVVAGDSVTLSGWGVARAEEGNPVSPDTPFRIASVAKVLVAATVLVEAQAGRADLQAAVEPVVGLPLAGAFPEPVTLHHLLTHTAGFDERLVGYAARSSEEMRPLGEYLSERMPERGWPAGELVSYSNHGMSLAAYLVERVAGRSFAEVAESALFEPLGMTSTAFLTSGVPIPSSAAQPLDCDEGECTARPHLYSHAYPAGLAFSTARDMSEFIMAVLASRGGEGGLADLIPERFSHDERIPGMSYGFFNQKYNGRRVLAHSGSASGYWSLLVIVPEEDVGFFFVANGGDSRFGRALRDELLVELMGQPSGASFQPRRSEDPASRAAAYELTRYSHRTIERFPQLFHNAIHVSAVGDTLLVYAGGSAERYLQVDDSLYRRVNGEALLAFGTRGGEPFLFRPSDVYGAGLPAAYELRPWYRTPSFVNEYVSWLLGVPILLMVFAWPVLAAVDVYLRRRRGKESRGFESSRMGVTLSATLAVAFFTWFGFAFVARSNRLLETGELFYGMPGSLSRLAWIPFAHAILTGLLVLLVPTIWKGRWWGVSRRIAFTLIVGALLLQVSFLRSWNYLPPLW